MRYVRPQQQTVPCVRGSFALQIKVLKQPLSPAGAINLGSAQPSLVPTSHPVHFDRNITTIN